MHSRTKSLGIIATAFLLVSAGSAWAQAAGQWRNGQHVYDKICQYCHESGVGPVLWGRELHSDYIAMRTRQGFAGMPSFRSTDIDDATLAKLADMIAKSPPPGDAGRKP